VTAVRGRELDAAGITDPALRASYARCRWLNARHGKTYYLATMLLPAAKRPYVHALYGFARYADEIVDVVDPMLDVHDRAEQLGAWGKSFLADLDRGASDDPVCRAVVHTVLRWQIPVDTFEDFLHAMAMDLTVREYATYDDLLGYVHGSAAVIGRQMVPVLGARSPDAYPAAEALGIAFQLANFVRDVGEDLDRGRLYLPLADLDRFGLTRADLERRIVDDRVRALLAFEVARVHRLEEQARPGIALLDPQSQPCIEAARRLYCGIADEVAAQGYDVFTRRARVPLRRRLAVAGPAWVQAVRARRGAAGEPGR
jgi:phytoene synthase